MTNLPSEEGYIKFQVHWASAPAWDAAQVAELNRWREVMRRHGLIGAYPDGVGFGNISLRWEHSDRFLISGSATGHLPALDGSHYSLVTAVRIDTNELWCEGPAVASSESMSHAAIYAECPWVGGVIHAHHLELWERLLHRVPTTGSDAAYGTPEMAYDIRRLLRTTDLPQQRLFVMEGHREGIFAFGANLEEAAERILRALTSISIAN